eukprot:2985872-Rhodomonas_salina.4
MFVNAQGCESRVEGIPTPRGRYASVPEQLARGCIDKGLISKLRYVVPTEKTQYATATMIVHTDMKTSGTAHGLQGCAPPPRRSVPRCSEPEGSLQSKGKRRNSKTCNQILRERAASLHMVASFLPHRNMTAHFSVTSMSLRTYRSEEDGDN